MSNLTIVQIDNELLVDSRLIADRLGIEHESFLKTIDNYQSQIQEAFGGLRFEIGVPSRPTGNPPRFVFLNEDQSMFVMTLSRNTPQVVQCKIDLVKAFSRAKAEMLSGNGNQERNVEPFDPFWNFVDRSIARNLDPKQAIELRLLWDGKTVRQPSKTAPSPTPKAKPSPKEDWADRIPSVVENWEGPFKTADILAALGVENTRAAQMTVARTLKEMGYRAARVRSDSNRQRFWI